MTRTRRWARGTLVSLGALAVTFALAAPAWALFPPPPIQVPQPDALTLLATGLAAGTIAWRWLRRR